MMKKLKRIEPQKEEDPKVMCNKIETLKIKCDIPFLGVCKAAQIGINASSS